MSDSDNFGRMSPLLRSAYENTCPNVKIIAQPASKVRFRSICEQRTSFIRSVNSTFPKIKINDHYGPSNDIVIIVSCVTKDQPYRVHPHRLSGPGTRDGFLVGRPTVSNEFELINIGIQRVKFNQVDQALLIRAQKRLPGLKILSSELQIDPFGHGFDHAKDIRREDLYAVRLAFQVFVQNRQGIWEALAPAVSDPIHDMAALSDLLQIRWLSDSSGSFAGGETVAIEFDKKVGVNTEVVFFEPCGVGRWKWQRRATILTVHHNTLVFKTPPYDERIEKDENVNVFFVVRRLSDNLCSIPCSFQYLLKPQSTPRQILQTNQESRNLQHQTISSILMDEE